MSKQAAEVLSIGGREVRVTHADKPYFSRQTKLSKRDLVRYYLSVAPGCRCQKLNRHKERIIHASVEGRKDLLNARPLHI
jgi:DNA primase